MAQTCDADENVAFIEKRAGRMEICMKKILHLIFGRFFVVAMAIILQVLWLCVVLWQLSYKFTYVNLLVRVIAIIVVLVIVNKWTNPANKLSWTFLILLSPIFGLMVYFLFGRSGLTKHTRERMDAVNRQVEALALANRSKACDSEPRKRRSNCLTLGIQDFRLRHHFHDDSPHGVLLLCVRNFRVLGDGLDPLNWW